ncbi:MAG TPA: class IV adenylate cyclase [Isosphaeraceae bacterium]|nr:class IV adenylate cyclase [Isosphaeraceae bacterium]
MTARAVGSTLIAMSEEHVGYEVEVKFRVPDLEALALRLSDQGADAGPPIAQEDVYLAHPMRNFSESDEALRIRRTGQENRVTYKGPKLGGPTKTREEIELTFEPGAEGLRKLTRLLERLGFETVAVIRKLRRPFALRFEGRPVEVVLDQATGLGSFAEVETLVRGPDDLPEAQKAVLGIAAALGLEDIERRSYLRMYMQQQAGTENPASGT